MSEEMCEEFEKWAAKNGFKMDRAPEPYFYDWASTASAWKAWQASRAALVVELPLAFDAAKEDACYYEYAYLKDEVEKALDKAGVNYK